MLTGLHKKTVLVTGAATGIGRAIAVAFAAAGANLVINHLRREAEAQVTAGLVTAAGADVRVLEADVTDQAAVDAMVEQAGADFGGIDVLVNNAGIVLVKPFLETSLKDWQQVIDTDLTSVFNCCRAVLPGMLARNSGCVINIVSELAYLGRDRYCAYTAAKGGVLSLTRSLAREFAPDIRVNAIAPGPTDTEMLASELTSEALYAQEISIPAGRIGKPEEIAGSAVFLASDQASFYCGDVLSPNGGALMR